MSTKYSSESLTKKWSDLGTKSLKGKTIKAIRYLTDSEKEDFMWYKNAPVIVFTDGTQIVAQCDDEGNDGGVLYIAHSNGDGETLPSIY